MREQIAKTVANAALNYTHNETGDHIHDLDCTDWPAYLDEADAILNLVGDHPAAAQAWDEGHDAGMDQADHPWRPPTPNPYEGDRHVDQ